jgi:hypothetical protein
MLLAGLAPFLSADPLMMMTGPVETERCEWAGGDAVAGS